MSTTTKPLTMLWSVVFQDGYIIDQPEDDRYSKHDDNAEWNPSAFRDIIDYEEKSPIGWFHLLADKHIYAVNLQTGVFSIDGQEFKLDDDDATRKLIYFRTMEKNNVDGQWQEPSVVSYNFGYEYKNKSGRTVKRIITLHDKL